MFKQIVDADGIKVVTTSVTIDKGEKDNHARNLVRIDDGWKCRQVVCDSLEVEDYLLKRLSESKYQFQIYDISRNKKNSYAELRRYVESHPVVVTGFEEYTNYIQETYYPNCFQNLYGKNYEEAKIWLYSRVINFCRDSIFLASHPAVVFVFRDSEYTIFQNLALDFCSYSGVPIDFNEVFQLDMDPRMDNLSDYYRNKRLFPERVQKIMQKLR